MESVFAETRVDWGGNYHWGESKRMRVQKTQRRTGQRKSGGSVTTGGPGKAFEK